MSNLDLASTETSSETVALEVINSTIRVDTIRGESRTLFASVFAALAIGSVLKLTQGKITHPLWFEQTLMLQGVLGGFLK